MAASREHDSALVEAARRGDQRAQDELVAAYLPLVYNIVGRALNGHADADDVVQETMIRALRGLGSLRDPGGVRSWLVAITMNQIRRHWHKHRAEPASSDLQEAYDVADPGADFVDLTIVRLGLEGQRREVADATRWLDTDDRALLSLWWLEAAGELGRAEVAAALELSPQHTAVRVQRMKAQLETARVVVRALSAVPRCVLLDQAIGIWDGIPSALWRKRIARHARDCALCSGFEAGLVPAEGLLVGLGLVPVAGVLGGLAGLAAFGGAGAPGDTAAFGAVGHTGMGDHDHTAMDSHLGVDGSTVSGKVPGAPGDDTAALRTVGGGRPHDRRSRRIQSRIQKRRRATAVAAAAALLITGGTVAGTALLSPDEERDRVQSASATESQSATPSAPATSPSPTASASPSPSPSKSTARKPSSTASAATPRPSKTKPAATNPAQQPKPTNPADSQAEKVLAIVNSERAKAGCRSLTLDDRLARAAQLHSEDMSANGYFDHTSQDGRTFVDRAQAQGHEAPGAENIARGQSSPEQVMESWMNSQGHRDNILNCSLTTMGLGLVADDWTWTQVFGS
ncbi:RNA polymerase [Streptomyces lunaelactis]|uniref:RNA polymerase sigma factor n=1 Tax=Streptomyces lunaelactis TaxID=1535768 RepID=A0A2R4SWI2_9ACTN|nr:sigma-70 family RNA polymerase sigma factor [Streptomyces lunaelactis]AVZ71243.1 RNA polymerase [Streptomyces lunaelactis]NUK88173.1 sigma-70 family RNA polymerase sigma factor [Streptomyces lunaelactis]NUL05372.1 sigma-70 family RNA polymerase sigma factor [Streptomyces lunaelactis]